MVYKEYLLNIKEKLITFHQDENGLEALEWALLLGAFVVPLIAAMFEIMTLVEKFYSLNSWIISLPFP